MRVKRLKHCKKFINFYKTTFGFREPFQILVDLTFCQFALNYKINIKEQIPKYIDGETQLYTTKCILEEGNLLGQQLYGALLVCKQFKLRKCSHQTPVTAQECIRSMIGASNEHHLFVATQDSELRDQLRLIPGIPLLRIHYNALVLEKPSRDTVTEAKKIDSIKISASDYEKERIDKMKKVKGLVSEDETLKQRKRKMKGVNPLAMKKKKRKNGGEIAGKHTENSKKRKRKKVKIAKHVLEELQKQKVSVNQS